MTVWPYGLVTTEVGPCAPVLAVHAVGIVVQLLKDRKDVGVDTTKQLGNLCQRRLLHCQQLLIDCLVNLFLRAEFSICVPA